MAESRQARYALPRQQRLRATDFQSVFRERDHRVERASLLAVWRPRPGRVRVGFAVGRKVGGAVLRNRARRRLREAYRQLGKAETDGFDVVFIGRAALLTCSFADLARDMGQAFAAILRSVEGGSARARAR